MRTDRVLLVLTVAANGIVTGATLDQGIKQLPARHTIGVTAYSAYSQAGDLGNGIAWYATIGVGTAVLALVTIAVALRTRLPGACPVRTKLPLWTALVGTVGYSVVTGVAAPLNFTQRDTTDEASLVDIFDRFAMLNAIRAGLMVLALVSFVVALLYRLRDQPALPSEGSPRAG